MTLGASAVAVAAIAGLATVGGLSAPSFSNSADLLSGGDAYSITQTVDNESSQTLTLTPNGVWVDNGGTIQPGYATSIAPKTSQTYVVTNSGNGVQLKLTFTTDNGATVVVDSDVPHHKENWSTATIAGHDLGLDSNFYIHGGDNPTAFTGIQDCSHECVVAQPGQHLG